MAKGGDHKNEGSKNSFEHRTMIYWDEFRFSWSRAFKCSVKSLGGWALNQALFLTNLHMRALLHNQL